MSQFVYSKTKGGVDKATQHRAMLRSPIYTLKWEQKIVLQTLKAIAANDFIAYRRQARQKLLQIAEIFDDFELYRNALNNFQSLWTSFPTSVPTSSILGLDTRPRMWQRLRKEAFRPKSQTVVRGQRCVHLQLENDGYELHSSTHPTASLYFSLFILTFESSLQNSSIGCFASGVERRRIKFIRTACHEL